MWDLQRNGMELEDYLSTGKRTAEVFWTCSLSHSYTSSVTVKLNRRRGCPYCANRKVLLGFNDLASTHPDIAATWDAELNEVSASEVIAGSERPYWFKCPRGHSYLMPLASRKRGRNCNICAGKVLAVGINDLLTVRPGLAKRLDPTIGLDPTQIIASTSRELPFVCQVGHAWWTVPSRVRSDDSCGVCSNQITVEGLNDLKTLRPDLQDQFDVEKNTLPFSELRLMDQRMVWWKCGLGHHWQQAVAVRRVSGCPVCSNLKVVSGINDLESRHPELAGEWDPEKNQHLSANQVYPGSNKRVWWKCSAGHSWMASIKTRAERGYGCPYCKGKIVISGETDLATTHPDIAQELDIAKSGIAPEDILPGSHKSVWWRCSKDSAHLWKAAVYSRTSYGSGCPVCTNQKIIAGINDLELLRPDIAKQWHPHLNGDLRPNEFSIHSTAKKIWWQCDIDNSHVWKTTISQRVGGTGCPGCAKTGGFDRTAPGILYFIENSKLSSMKVGITNSEVKEKRLEKFMQRGWRVIKVWSFDNGTEASEVERITLRWIRQDLDLPPHLDSGTIGRQGGWSETFSGDGVSPQSIIKFIESLIDERASR